MSISLPAITPGITNWAGTVNGYWATIQSYLNATLYSNAIINGGFPVWQRGVTNPTTSDNAYGADRWRLLLGAANAATIARDTDAPTTSKYSCKLTVGSANNNKFGIFQIIEGVNVYALRGQSVTVSVQLKASSTIGDIRIGICQWASTEDNGGSVFPDPVYSWNSALTNPQLTTWTYLNSPTNVSPTTNWLPYQATATVDPTATNLAVFIWCDDTTTTTGDVMRVAEVSLIPGTLPAPWIPRSIQQELTLCQRYCISYGSEATYERIGVGQAYSLTAAYMNIFLPVPMRAIPTISFSNAGNFYLSNSVATAKPANSIQTNMPSSKVVNLLVQLSTNDLSAGNAVEFGKYNNTSDLFIISAEL